MLSLSQKFKIKKLNSFESVKKLAKDFSVGNSTVSDMKRDQEEILPFLSSTEHGHSEQKTVKPS